MKRVVLLLIGIAVIILPSCAQKNMDFKRLCEKYQDTEKVESFGMEGLECMLASFLASGKVGGNSEVGALLRQFTSLQVLTCEGERIKELSKDIKSFIKSSSLEELFSIKEEKEEISVYIATGKKKVSQVFIAVIDADAEAVFIQVNGKFERSSIKKLFKTTEISYLCH